MKLRDLHEHEGLDIGECMSYIANYLEILDRSFVDITTKVESSIRQSLIENDAVSLADRILEIDFKGSVYQPIPFTITEVQDLNIASTDFEEFSGLPLRIERSLLLQGCGFEATQLIHYIGSLPKNPGRINIAFCPLPVDDVLELFQHHYSIRVAFKLGSGPEDKMCRLESSGTSDEIEVFHDNNKIATLDGIFELQGWLIDNNVTNT